jgi:HlyD family secretion protein
MLGALARSIGIVNVGGIAYDPASEGDRDEDDEGNVMVRAIVWILVLGALGAGGWWWWNQQHAASDQPAYRTAPVTRTEIVSSISASGTVYPEDVIDVGTQVNGQIIAFGVGTDGKPVDYRSTVVEGALLAKIDDTLYQADVASGEAMLAQAKAQVQVAEANHAQAIAKKAQAERDWARAEKLGQSKALSQADFDAAKSAFEQAIAGVGVADAQIAQAKAAVQNSEASLSRSRRNLVYCTINSPVSGVVINRSVQIGQTVISSLNAPSLFLIAKDLSRMQVLVQVNEADIDNVRPGGQVTFTTDAFPGETFRGEVRKVRLNAQITQNVVTYTVEITTENKSLRLLPLLTANVRFIQQRRENVLAVPNAALRWAPAGYEAEKPDRSGGAGSRPASRGEGRGERAQGSHGDRPSSRPGGGRGGWRPGTLWVLDGEKPRMVTVRAGITDGTLTEVASEDLHEGDLVIVGEQVAAPAGGQGSNPFAPQNPFGGRGQRR